MSQAVNDIELRLSRALADDIEATIDQPVTVLHHVSVCYVMFGDGTTQEVWTATEGLPEYALGGLTDWLYNAVRDNDR